MVKVQEFLSSSFGHFSPRYGCNRNRAHTMVGLSEMMAPFCEKMLEICFLGYIEDLDMLCNQHNVDYDLNGECLKLYGEYNAIKELLFDLEGWTAP